MRKFIYWAAIVTLLVQVSTVEIVSAKLYTWVDKNGVTRRTYYPPPADQVMKKKTTDRARVVKKRGQNQVDLYVTSWCPYCKQAADFFRSNGVKYNLYDIEKDRKAAARKEKLDSSGGGVPFAVVNGMRISGYAPAEYARALK